MTDEKARIQLAEAMGWVGINAKSLWGYHPDAPRVFEGRRTLPDPFTDANDDYAVLEWMRNHRGKYCGVIYNVMDGESVDYKIGDWARAALEVIE